MPFLLLQGVQTLCGKAVRMVRTDDFKGRALVIDDDPHERAFLSEALRTVGFSVDSFAQGHSALNGSDAGNYQVVLSKLRLPDLPALELVRALRGLGSAIPVLLLSDTFSRDELEESVSLGVHCLTRPLRLRTLIGVLERLPGLLSR
jgi:DNA-binding response OmpR family regulator